MPLVNTVWPSVAHPVCSPPMGLGNASTRGSSFSGGCVGAPVYNVDFPSQHSRRGMHDADGLLGILGGETPFLDEFADVRGTQERVANNFPD
jgi:hypothetical protein